MATYDKEINIIVKDQGIDKVTKDVNNLNKSVENLADSQDDLSSSMKNNKQSVLDNGGAVGLLNELTGGLASTVKDAVEATALFAKESKIGATVQKAYALAVGTSSGAMKIFRLALISTGIGAIVVAIGLLIANFDKVKKVVLNLVPGLAIVGELFTGLIESVTDFVGVTSDATRALDKLGEQASKSLEKNKFALEAYGDQYDEFTKRKIDAVNKLNEQIKALQEDETLSEEQKLERIAKLRDRANRDIEQAEADRSQKRADARQKEQEKIDAENKAAAEKRKVEREARDKEILEERKKDLEGTEENAQQRRVVAASAFNQVLEDGKTNSDALFAQVEAGAMATTEMLANQNQIRLDNEAATLKHKEELRKTDFANASALVGLVKELGEKNKAVQRAAIIAQGAIGIGSIVTNTMSANAAALAPPPLGLGPVAGNALVVRNLIGAGIGISQNVASTAKALKAIGGGGAPATTTLSGGGGGGATAPSFNLVSGSGTNQIAQSIQGQDKPIKAYVVSGEMTTQQSIDRNVIATASI